MFFFILGILLFITYFIVAYFLQLFFDGKIGKANFSSVHILLFLGVYFVFIVFANSLENIELGNRVQHALGGGFMIVMIFYFSLLASQVQISKFQFLCLALLVATAFGVANELAESIFQMQKIMLFSMSIADTWLDLWANTFGSLLGVLVFIFFVKKEK